MEISDKWCSLGISIWIAAVQHLRRWQGEWDQVCWWLQAEWSGRDAMQRLERWACEASWNSKRWSARSSTWLGEILSTGTGWEENEWMKSSPGDKVLGMKNLTWLAVCAHSSESKPDPGLHQKECGQQVKRGDSTLLCIQFWGPHHRKGMRELGSFREKEVPGGPHCSLPVVKGGYKRAGEALFNDRGETLEQRSCGSSIPGSVQSQVRWGFEQPHCSEVGTRWFSRCVST